MEDKDKKIIIGCDCGMHLLQLETDREIGCVYVALFTYGNGNTKPNIWNRLKRAWQVLKTGHLYSDQLVISKGNLRELKKFLDDAEQILPENPSPIVAIVNGRDLVVRSDEFGKISYESIVSAIGKDPNEVWTVTYSIKNGPAGILHHGQSIVGADGMVFNIQKTNNA